MPKQTQLPLTAIKRKPNCYYNRRLQRLRKARHTGQMSNSLIKILLKAVAVMQQFHTNDQNLSETAAAAAAEGESEQIDPKTRMNQHQSMEENHRRQGRTAYLSIDKWKLSAKLTPNYSKFPQDLFKHLLCEAVPRYNHQINEYLTNSKLLSFNQQYAHLMCMIFQLEMEKDFWKHAINTLPSASNWLLRMSKDLTKRYSINWDYPRTENNIRHRQRLTENKLDRAIRELQLHLEQYSSCWTISDNTSIDQIMTIISEALLVVVKNGLQKLHTNFEEKKILMQFDVDDVDRLKSFYDLNPSEEQKLMVEKIWRAKRKSSQRTIQQMATNSIDKKQATTVQDHASSMFEESNRLYIAHDYQRDRESFLQSLSPVMRTIID